MLKKAEKATEEAKAIAWQAQKRLCHRYRVLLRAGKIKGQIITAIAGELMGFVRFATLMRLLCRKNGGAFVGLSWARQ